MYVIGFSIQCFLVSSEDSDLKSFKYTHFFEERFREFEKELQPKICCSPVRFDNSRQRLI